MQCAAQAARAAHAITFPGGRQDLIRIQCDERTQCIQALGPVKQ